MQNKTLDGKIKAAMQLCPQEVAGVQLNKKVISP